MSILNCLWTGFLKFWTWRNFWLICSANQWTYFYMITASVLKWLRYDYERLELGNPILKIFSPTVGVIFLRVAKNDKVILHFQWHSKYLPVDTGRKLNVNETFRICPVPTGKLSVDHSFSTYAKFSGNGSFLGNFAYVPNGFRRLNNFFPQPLLSQKIKMQFFVI